MATVVTVGSVATLALEVVFDVMVAGSTVGSGFGQKAHPLHLHLWQCARAYLLMQKLRHCALSPSFLNPELHGAPSGSPLGMGGRREIAEGLTGFGNFGTTGVHPSCVAPAPAPTSAVAAISKPPAADALVFPAVATSADAVVALALALVALAVAPLLLLPSLVQPEQTTPAEPPPMRSEVAGLTNEPAGSSSGPPVRGGSYAKDGSASADGIWGFTASERH